MVGICLIFSALGAPLRAPGKLLLTGRRRQSIDRLQYGLRAQTSQQILGQVFPPDGARWIDQELGRTRDVATLLASVFMQDAVGSNRGGVRVGKEWEGIAAGSAEFARFFGRVHTDRDKLRVASGKIG
jgi:hypothetical protein